MTVQTKLYSYLCRLDILFALEIIALKQYSSLDEIQHGLIMYIHGNINNNKT